jgi:hypothetical protein
MDVIHHDPNEGVETVVNSARLHLKIQYIYSKSKLTSATIEKWDDHIKEFEDKNEKLKADLINLYSPFDFLESLNK